MSVKLVICLLLQTAVVVLAGVRSIPETILRERSMGNEFLRWEPRLDGRIIGGQRINITEAPYQISLQKLIINTLYHICGGSLISKEWILTAVHCIGLDSNTKQLKVRVGSENNEKGGQVLGLKKVITHEKFVSETLDYDVALLQLETPIEFDETKQAVKLPKQGQEFGDGEMCYVSGWGYTRNDQESQEYLRKVQESLVNQKECIEKNEFVTDSMICASNLEGGKGSCRNDSGGPLVNRDGVLVGVVSWGHECANPKYPSVYCRVSYVREWIKKHSGV